MTANRREGLSDEQRRQMIAEAAYYRAEHNGFTTDSLEDWLKAEAEIDRLLREGKGGEEEAGKQSFRERFEHQLGEWDERLEEFKQASEEMGHKVGQDLQGQLAKMAQIRAAAQQQLFVLREHSSEAWDEVRKGAEHAIDELRSAISKFAAGLKKVRDKGGNSRSTSSRPRT